MAAAWTDLPLILIAAQGALLGHATLANLTPARPDLLWTAVFPLGVVAAVYALRWRTATSERRVAVITLAGTLAVLGLTVALAPRLDLSNDQLRGIYEASSVAQTGLLCWHAWTQRRALAALLLGPVALYGVVLENGGILLGYFRELGYSVYVGPLPAPLATMAGWITVFYLSVYVAWAVGRCLPTVAHSAGLSALVATLAALSLDLQIDPLATAVGLWTWHELLPDGPLGVPVVNFVAWFCAVLPFSWALFHRSVTEQAQGYAVAERAHRRWLWAHLPWVLLAATALFCTAMALIEGGFDGPAFAVLRRAICPGP